MQVISHLPVKDDGSDILYEYRHNHRFTPGLRGNSRLFAAIIPCLTGIGCIYQTIASVRDQRAHPPPGRLLDINGCRLHVQMAGVTGPSVVLEAGLGGMSSAWGWIQPEAAKFSRVFSYDRSGLGWSDPDSSPKSAVLAAQRLRSVLILSGVQPPFVLVGHSMGGLFIRIFAHLFSGEVAGMVFLDAAHPDQHLRSEAIDTHMRSGFRFLEAVPLLTRLGYVRLAGIFNLWADGLPAQQSAESLAFLSAYQHLKTTRDESLAWEAICKEVRCTSGLTDIPLAVVTAAKGVLPGHPELQRDLAALSSDSVHFTVKGADHVTLVTRREYALAVVEAIRHVVERAGIL
jgi:pimeloyl-ACP methyl ester carboxylesterase